MSVYTTKNLKVEISRALQIERNETSWILCTDTVQSSGVCTHGSTEAKKTFWWMLDAPSLMLLKSTLLTYHKLHQHSFYTCIFLNNWPWFCLCYFISIFQFISISIPLLYRSYSIWSRFFTVFVTRRDIMLIVGLSFSVHNKNLHL